jgi:hypothetical protein
VPIKLPGKRLVTLELRAFPSAVGAQEENTIGFLDETTRAIFGRCYAADSKAYVSLASEASVKRIVSSIRPPN